VRFEFEIAVKDLSRIGGVATLELTADESSVIIGRAMSQVTSFRFRYQRGRKHVKVMERREHRGLDFARLTVWCTT
jgi:hypothetical protein